jgi:predicted transcriptional regulator
MQTQIPTAAEVRAELQTLNYSQSRALAKLAKVPFTTLLKIRSGVTPNPRIETVRMLLPHVKAAGRMNIRAVA